MTATTSRPVKAAGRSAKPTTLHVEVRGISPTEAAGILSHLNDANRVLNANRVTHYAKAMREGRWVLTHQGIAFRRDGSLHDGQHRLAAVVEADVTVEFMVTAGLADTDVVDTGKPRSAADVLRIHGMENVNQAAALAKLVMMYDRGDRPWDRMTRILDHHEIRVFVEADAERIMQAIRDGTTVARRITGSSTLYATGLYLLRRWVEPLGLQEMADDYYQGLATGVSLEKGDARLALARWITQGGRLLSPADRREIIPMLVTRCAVAVWRGDEFAKVQINRPRSFTYRIENAKV